MWTCDCSTVPVTTHAAKISSRVRFMSDGGNEDTASRSYGVPRRKTQAARRQKFVRPLRWSWHIWPQSPPRTRMMIFRYGHPGPSCWVFGPGPGTKSPFCSSSHFCFFTHLNSACKYHTLTSALMGRVNVSHFLFHLGYCWSRWEMEKDFEERSSKSSRWFLGKFFNKVNCDVSIAIQSFFFSSEFSGFYP